MIDFTTLQGLSVPEGVVTKIERDGVVLWELQSYEPIILEVEKITSDTYAGETTYTGEQFILLDIYPKTNGIVSVTYGGLTKTVTDTSGAEKPNAQQVFFGTFNGVSDSVATPASGTLTIEGDYYAFGEGCFDTKKMLGTAYSRSTLEIVSMGAVTMIPNYAFGCLGVESIESETSNTKITKVTIPASVTEIGSSAFSGCTGLTEVIILAKEPPGYIDGVVGTLMFERTTCIIVVPKGCADAYKAADIWKNYADRITEAS